MGSVMGQRPCGEPAGRSAQNEGRVPSAWAGGVGVSSHVAVLPWQGGRRGRGREGLWPPAGRHTGFPGQVPLRQKNEGLQPSSAGG